MSEPTLFVRFGAKFNDLDKAFGHVDARTKGLQSNLSGVGRAMTVGLSLPLAAIGAASLKMGRDLNAGMANISALIPGNTARILELKTAVQKTAVAMGKGTTDMADGLYDLISTLGDSKDSVKLLEINAKAAAAGLATTKDAIGLTTAVTKTYGDTSAEATKKVADMAFQAVNIGKTTFPELSASIGAVTPLAQAAGVKLTELFAVLATATGVTGNTSEVVTQMRSGLTALMDPTKDMTDLLRKLGYAGAQAGQDLIAEHGYVGALTKIKQQAEAMDMPLGKVLGRVEAQTLTLSLASSQAQNYTKNLGLMNKEFGRAAAEAGALDTAFVAQTQGINKAGFQWEQFKVKLETTAQTIGDRLLPIVVHVAETLKPLGKRVLDLVDAFGTLPAGVQAAAFVIAGLAAAGGPLLMLASSLISAANNVTKLSLAFKEIQWVNASMGLFKLPWAAAAAQAGLYGLAIGGLIVLFVELTKHALAAAKAQSDAMRLKYNPTGGRDYIGGGGLTPNATGGFDLPGGLGGMPGLPWDQPASAAGGGAKKKPRIDPEFARAVDELYDKLSGKEHIAAAKQWMAVLGKLGGIGKLTKAEQKDLNSVLKDALEKYRALGQDAPLAMRSAELATRDLSEQAEQLADDVAAINKGLEVYGGLLGVLQRGKTIDPFGRPASPVNPLAGPPTLHQPGKAETPWQTWLEDQRRALAKATEYWKAWGQNLQFVTADVFAGMLTGAVTFSDGFKSIFSELGRMGTSILSDMIGEWTGKLKKFFLDAQSGQLGATGQKIAGIASAGLVGGVVGYGVGSKYGKAKGALAGAASGAVAGLPYAAYTSGASVAIGAGVGAIAGWWGGKKKEKQQREQMATDRAALLDQFGGMENLRKIADSVGVAIDKAFSTKKPEEFGKIITQLNEALQQQQSRLDGLAMAVEGVNARATGLIEPFRKLAEQIAELTDEQKALGGKDDAQSLERIAAIGAELKKLNTDIATGVAGSQQAFNTLGESIAVTFAGKIMEGASAMDAFKALAPAFAALSEGVNKFGFAMTPAIASLLDMQGMVEKFGPEFQAAFATGQIITGLGQAKLLTTDLASALGTDLATQLGKIEAGGGDVAKAMAMMQPQLQALWEYGQKNNVTWDDATAAMLKNAEASGIVGQSQKSAMSQVLDVLIDIRDLFKGGIPEAMARLPQAAREAADGMNDAFDDIRMPNIADPVKWRQYERGDIPAMAEGGVVWGPTLALIGEKGPELVTPLANLPSTADMGMGGGGGGAAATNVVQFQLSTPIAAIDSIRAVVEEEIGPRLLSWLEANKAGARTRLREILT